MSSPSYFSRLYSRGAPCSSSWLMRLRLKCPRGSTLTFSACRRRFLSSHGLVRNDNELVALREQLRPLGTESDSVSLHLAQDCPTAGKQLQALGDTTAVITLCNPTARNALTGQMMAQLADAVDELENNASWQESLTAVVVQGDGGFFCAGADIRVAADHLSTKEGGATMSKVMIDTLTRLRHLPFVTVAAIRGGAVGGGAELVTAMDYRMMQDTAALRFVHARMGVSPGWGGATRLVRLVGRPQALALLGTAEKCDATKCLEIGLVDQLVPPTKQVVDDANPEHEGDDIIDSMEAHLVKFLDPFVHADPSVLHAAKRVVAGSEDLPTFADAVAHEQKVFLEMWGGPANRAALAAASKKKT